MNLLRLRFVLLICCLFVLNLSYADILIDDNGNEYTGKVTEKDGKWIIKTDVGTLYFKKTEVAKVVRKNTKEEELKKMLLSIDESSIEELKDIAKWAEENGLNEQALELYWKMVKIDNNNLVANSAIVTAYRIKEKEEFETCKAQYEKEKYGVAKKFFERFMAKYPETIFKDDIDKMFEKIPEFEFNSLLNFVQNSKNVNTSIKKIEAFVEDNPKSPYVVRAQSMLTELGGREALGAQQNVGDKAGKVAKISVKYKEKVDKYINEGNEIFDEARDLSNEIIRTYRKRSLSTISSQISKADKEYKKAHKKYKSAVSSDSKKEYEEVTQQRIVKLNDSWCVFYYRCAIVYFNHRNYQKALDYTNKSLKVNPDYLDAQNMKRNCERYLRRGNRSSRYGR